MPLGVPTYALRAPGSTPFSWVFHSFTDELAHAAEKICPFRLDLLNAPRRVQCFTSSNPGDAGIRRLSHHGVLKLVAEKSGWARASSEGHGHGSSPSNSHIAAILRKLSSFVSTPEENQVNKIWVAGDVGSQIINPIKPKIQVRGAVIEDKLRHVLRNHH